MQTRKQLLIVVLLVFFSCLILIGSIPAVTAQEDYPTKPIKILNPSGPGTPDLVSRTLSESLSKEFKVDITVEYKVGGSGMIGADYVAKGKPDGYMILCGSTSSNLFGPVLNPGTCPYDPIKDFAPIAYAGATPNVMFVNSQSAFKSFDQLLDYGKKNPDT